MMFKIREMITTVAIKPNISYNMRLSQMGFDTENGGVPIVNVLARMDVLLDLVIHSHRLTSVLPSATLIVGDIPWKEVVLVGVLHVEAVNDPHKSHLQRVWGVSVLKHERAIRYDWDTLGEEESLLLQLISEDSQLIPRTNLLLLISPSLDPFINVLDEDSFPSQFCTGKHGEGRFPYAGSTEDIDTHVHAFGRGT